MYSNFHVVVAVNLFPQYFEDDMSPFLQNRFSHIN